MRVPEGDEDESMPAVNTLDESVCCPAQKSLPVRTETTSTVSTTSSVSWSPAAVVCRECSGVPLTPGEMGSAPTQPELWKYSRVGTERRAAPSSPQCAMSSACGAARVVRERRNARGEAAYWGECARA